MRAHWVCRRSSQRWLGFLTTASLVLATVSPVFLAQRSLAQDTTDHTYFLPVAVSFASPANYNSTGPIPNPFFDARIVGAVSTATTTVKVAFSKPMGTSAVAAENYTIARDNGSGDPSRLTVVKAEFVDAGKTTVLLTTLSQEEANYILSAPTVLDAWGFPLGPKQVVSGILVDPTSARFTGTASSGVSADADQDGLPDYVEQAGYTIQVYPSDGVVTARHVTSDPLLADTDQDGITDADEKAYGADPRQADTDADTLGDYLELTHIYSDPARQDSDGDGYADGLELNLFETSPIFADSDGDQIRDGDEIAAGNRNPRVSDLPKPAIEVGDVNLQVDVRFTEATTSETRELEKRSTETTLQQTQKQSYSNMNSNTQKASAKLTIGTKWEVNAGNPFNSGAKYENSVQVEAGWSGSWTHKTTESSEAASVRAHKESMAYEGEKTLGATVNREVQGARMQVAIFIKNAGNVAFAIRHLQVTALMQDPQNPADLIPVATLLPSAEPDEGFSLGPLTPERGPFIFSNDTIYPNLVDQLMANPNQLTFQISNFDITDELGRNFAFSSQAVVERTASLVIDRGSYDSNGDGEGDLTEYHRIATGTGRLFDTNGDGIVDAKDSRAVFDLGGHQLGITLRDAFKALNLTAYNEDQTPTAGLSDGQIASSYSTRFYTQDGETREVIWRIGPTITGNAKAWEILMPTGIDRTLDLDEHILTAGSDLKLLFVSDLDHDRLPANLEYVYGCSDVLADTDGDTIPDLDEALIGFDVETGRGTLKVFSSCLRTDSDEDGISDAVELGKTTMTCADGVTVVDRVASPTDPASDDTDMDGVTDFEELCGYPVDLRSGVTVTSHTSPNNPDSDGDTGLDGIERELGGNPEVADLDSFADYDGDGLVNVLEQLDGWTVTTVAVSASPSLCNTTCNEGASTSIHVVSNHLDADSDDDGILDGEEYARGTNPMAPDSDGDGLTDFQEMRGTQVRDLGVLLTDPLDADTDNDKLSDGAEAELNNTDPAAYWIVRAAGESPRRVFSHPLQPDADFDRLVDGDERAVGTDPALANTDGDRRDDMREVALGLNPLVEDYKITVAYTSYTVQYEDSGAGSDDVEFTFRVQKPDEGQPSGLASPTTVLGDSNTWYWLPTCVENGYDMSPTPCYGSFGLSMYKGNTLVIPDSKGSITFSLTKNQRFSILGSVSERDASGNNIYLVSKEFGGLDGVKAKIAGTDTQAVFQGSTVASQSIVEMTFTVSGYPAGVITVRYFVE